MPGISGMEMVRKIRSINSDTEIIILTGSATLESALDALREHVFEFLQKPVKLTELLQVVLRAQQEFRKRKQERELLGSLTKERQALQKQAEAFEKRLSRSRIAPTSLVGDSPKMRQIRDQISVVAPSGMTVLIRGESGTGKDVVAQMLHRTSGREMKQRLTKVNCPALPESLLESELFGYERGSFTSAVKEKPGRFEIAEGGTIFLDEIGALSMSIQAKLLQVIEQKEFMRIGGTKPVRADTRILAATNSPLENMISMGDFREDLFYRLDRFTITVPPLREHMEDLPILINHFLARFGLRYQRWNLSLPDEFMSRLERYYWPGNVRELEAMIERYALTGDVASIDEHLNSKKATAASPPTATKPAPPASSNGNLEAEAVLNALADARWNRRRAADLLGMSYSTLRRRIAKYDLDGRFSIHSQDIEGSSNSCEVRQ
jgi:DNA-binding NtrC family response regulator